MTFVGRDVTVTTWGETPEGEQVWRARSDAGVAEFVAPRDAPVADLFRLAKEALAA